MRSKTPTRESPPPKADSHPELAVVSRLRGLPARAPLVLHRISRDKLKAHLETTFDAHMPERARRGTEEMLIGLGVVPPDFDYRASIIQLMQTELAGLYDPAENAMFLLEDLSPEMEKATLQHELVHALQDQNFSLDRITTFSEDQTDELSALSSLAEGDATSVMFDAVLEAENKTALDVPSSILERQLSWAAERQVSPSVPNVLVRALLAPYIDGMAFVQQERKRGGFAAVDEAWRNPPTTTEQLLHRDRYEKREPAVSVPVPKPPNDTGAWKETLHDIWGEQSWRVILEEFAAADVAREAAAGWGGDRIVAYRNGNERAVAAVIVMDSESDAQEMVRGFQGGQAKENWCASRPGFTALAVGRKQKAVVLSSRTSAKGESTCEPSIQYNLRIQSQL